MSEDAKRLANQPASAEAIGTIAIWVETAFYDAGVKVSGIMVERCGCGCGSFIVGAVVNHMKASVDFGPTATVGDVVTGLTMLVQAVKSREALRAQSAPAPDVQVPHGERLH